MEQYELASWKSNINHVRTILINSKLTINFEPVIMFRPDAIQTLITLGQRWMIQKSTLQSWSRLITCVWSANLTVSITQYRKKVCLSEMEKKDDDFQFVFAHETSSDGKTDLWNWATRSVFAKHNEKRLRAEQDSFPASHLHANKSLKRTARKTRSVFCKPAHFCSRKWTYALKCGSTLGEPTV